MMIDHIDDPIIIDPPVPEEEMVLNLLLGKRWKIRQSNLMPWSTDTYNGKEIFEIYSKYTPGQYSIIVWIDGRWIGAFGQESVKKGFHPGKQNV